MGKSLFLKYSYLMYEKCQVFVCMVKYFVINLQLSERFSKKSSTLLESYKMEFECLFQMCKIQVTHEEDGL